MKGDEFKEEVKLGYWTTYNMNISCPYMFSLCKQAVMRRLLNQFMTGFSKRKVKQSGFMGMRG